MPALAEPRLQLLSRPGELDAHVEERRRRLLGSVGVQGEMGDAGSRPQPAQVVDEAVQEWLTGVGDEVTHDGDALRAAAVATRAHVAMLPASWTVPSRWSRRGATAATSGS